METSIKRKELTGVVAEYDGEYFGVQFKDSNVVIHGFGPIDKAMIFDPLKYHNQEDIRSGFLHNLKESVYSKLEHAILIKIKKETTFTIDHQ